MSAHRLKQNTEKTELCGQVPSTVWVNSSHWHHWAQWTRTRPRSYYVVWFESRETCLTRQWYLLLSSQIRRVRQSLDVGSAKTLMQAFVTSRVDYCNAVLAESPRVITDKLQRVMNSAARIVTNTRKYDSRRQWFVTINAWWAPLAWCHRLSTI